MECVVLEKSFITRRIDELGRIVIPKEIRNNLAIRVGEPLEILIENKSIVIRKYSQVENIKDISNKVCNIISDICKIDLLVSDREKIIVTSKKLNALKERELPNELKRLIDDREQLISDKKDDFFDMNKYFIMIPIITSTDCSGLIIIVSDEKNNENLVYAKIASKLIIDSLDVI